MKKLLIGLLAVASISGFAQEKNLGNMNLIETKREVNVLNSCLNNIEFGREQYLSLEDVQNNDGELWKLKEQLNETQDQEELVKLNEKIEQRKLLLEQNYTNGPRVSEAFCNLNVQEPFKIGVLGSEFLGSALNDLNLENDICRLEIVPAEENYFNEHGYMDYRDSLNHLSIQIHQSSYYGYGVNKKELAKCAYQMMRKLDQELNGVLTTYRVEVDQSAPNNNNVYNDDATIDYLINNAIDKLDSEKGDTKAKSE